MNKDLPKISFVIPVLNEEKRIKKCLDSIKKQKYNWNKIEVLVVDGGSTDKTVNIVKEFGFKVIYNSQKLADIGSHLGYEKAKGDLVVIMAADNVLVEKDWLLKMVKPFIYEKNVGGAFCKYDTNEDDKDYSKIALYINGATDPFNLFVYGRERVYYPLLHRKYFIEKLGKDYDLYRFSLDDFPLIALAQGFIINKKLLGNKILEWWKGDDILPIIRMIEMGYKLAYVKNASIKHYIFENFSHFIKKMDRKIQLAFLNPQQWGFVKRKKYLNRYRKIKSYLFVFYAFSVIIPFIHSLYWIVKYKEKDYMLYHTPATFITACLIIKNFIKYKILK